MFLQCRSIESLEINIYHLTNSQLWIIRSELYEEKKNKHVGCRLGPYLSSCNQYPCRIAQDFTSTALMLDKDVAGDRGKEI